MISRRRFILATIGTIATPMTFIDKAFAYLENHGEPLIQLPKKSSEILYVDNDQNLQFCLGSLDVNPPPMTYGEFMFKYDSDFYFDDPDLPTEDQINEDEEVPIELLFDAWARTDSPWAKAHKLLEHLPRYQDTSETFRGDLIFYDCPFPASDYLGVHAGDLLTLSLVQEELNIRNRGIAIELI